MSEGIEASSAKVVGGLSWYQVWLRATTRPSVATFEELVRDPDASPGRAYSWAFLTALIAVVFTALVYIVFPGAYSTFLPQARATGDLSIDRPSLLFCLSPISAGIAVLLLIIAAGLTHWIARALGGTGSYAQLVYAFAAFVAPLYLLISLLAMIPFIQCFTPLLTVYILVLTVIAVKAVYGFGWGKAVLSPFLLPGILLLCNVLVIVTLAILGSNLSQ